MSTKNPVLQHILDTQRVTDADGTAYPLRAHISRREGELIQTLLRENQFQETLEIGCAFGISSLYICEAIADQPRPRHVIIDPNQYGSNWHGVGMANLKRAGYTFVELREQVSELAMPALLADGQRFDLIFIDGWHTFDHTLLDAYYATRLLRPNGILVIDDCTLPSVGKVISYLKQYPCYETVGAVPDERPSIKRRLARLVANVVPEKAGQYVLPARLYSQVYREDSMVALRKVGPDERGWLWYAHF